MQRVAIFIALIFCASSIACKSSLERLDTTVSKSNLDTESADSVTLKYGTNGNLRAKLQAKTFVHEQEDSQPYVAMRDGLKITFYDAAQQITSTLTSRSGRYFEKNNNVLLRDSVVVKNIKNEELHTDELVWNESKKIFFTEKNVTIKTATQIIYGTGMEANQDFTHYRILSPKGIIAVPKGKIPSN